MGPMQPVTALARPARVRLPVLAAVVLALSLLVAPAATVQACSCQFLGGTVDAAQQAIADADVAFIGTVVDAGAAPADPGGFGPMVSYAFEVERATLPVAKLIEVRALDDGASCGFTFGLDETWFVTTYEQEGVLNTGLCSGNTELETLAEPERDQIAALMTVEPVADSPTVGGIPWIPIGGLALGIVAVAALTVLAFRRDGPS